MLTGSQSPTGCVYSLLKEAWDMEVWVMEVWDMEVWDMEVWDMEVC